RSRPASSRASRASSHSTAVRAAVSASRPRSACSTRTSRRSSIASPRGSARRCVMNPEHDLRPSVPPSVRAGALPPFRTNLILFLLTIVSVFHAGVAFAGGADERSFLRQLLDPEYLMRGASFAVPLLGILLTHEFGHFFAARWH